MARTNPFEKYLTKEDRLQNSVINYIKMQYPGTFAIHVPNEGKRSPFERYKFKYLGGVAGVPDLMLFAPRGKYSGLALELKVGYNKPTENQLNCLERLKNASWDAQWCNSFDKAKTIIDKYMSHERL